MIVPVSVHVSYDGATKLAHVQVNAVGYTTDNVDDDALDALRAVKAVSALMTSGREHWIRTEPCVSVERDSETETDRYHARARFSVKAETE